MKQVKGKYRRFEDGTPYRLPEDINNGPNPTPPCPVTDDDIELTKVPKMDVSEFWRYDWHDGVINKDSKTQTGMEDPGDQIIRQNNPNPYMDAVEDRIKNTEKRLHDMTTREIEIEDLQRITKNTKEHGPVLAKFIEDGRERETEQIKKVLDKNLRRGMLTKEEEEAIAQKLEKLKATIKEYKEDMDRLGQDLREKLEEINTVKIPNRPYSAPVCEVIKNTNPSGMFRAIADKIVELHDRKNHDYGNAAHESYKEFGLVSYVIRLNDKLNRLKSLTKSGAEQQVKEESIVDTLMDLAAYSIMAIESLKSDE